MSEITIYQAKDGSTDIQVRFEQDTCWLSQAQMVELFGRSQPVISRHVNSALKEGEISEKSNMQKMHIANSDRPVVIYDLDVVISVGYRVKSPRGVQFRRWATQRLREYMTQGYALNRQRFEENARELEAALTLIQKASHSPELGGDVGRGLVDIVTRYTQTFLLLQRYDEGLLTEPQTAAGGKLVSQDPTDESASELLARIRAEHAAAPTPKRGRKKA
ncbi:MAG: RhuM family protein [Mariprofundaceae bacterium]|nr:RhuM family protein [Mariprofundaceae bacterium]